MEDNPKTPACSDPDEKKHQYEFLAGRDPVLLMILLLLLLFVLKYAAAILMPITLAVMLSLLFAPVVNFLTRLHISKRIGAALVVLFIAGTFTGIVIGLSDPAEEWVAKSPQAMRVIEKKLQKIKSSINQMRKAVEKVEDLAEFDKKESQVVVEQAKGKKLLETVFMAAPNILAFVVLSIILLYFLLFSGEDVARYLVRLISRLAHRHCPLNLGESIQQQISRYLFTVAIINICLGAVIAAAMAVLGLPNPVLWGTMACVLNFAPYIGAVITAICIAIVSVLTFDPLWHILLPPSVFLLITSVEGQFVTPIILGRRFSLNPLIIFISIIIWGWMWGYVGALLAVPLLVTAKIICQSVDSLEGIALFLEGSESQSLKGD